MAPQWDGCRAEIPAARISAHFVNCQSLRTCETCLSWTDDPGLIEFRVIGTFVEARSCFRLPSVVFVLKKRLSVLLHWLFPRWYLPLYTMVEFTRIPYADAVRRARRQEWAVAGVFAALVLAALLLIGVLTWN